MKIVTCEHCGAKFSLKDHEFPYNFECSVCAGNLMEENGSNPNLDHWYLKSEKNSSNTYVVKCKNCGLKYALNSNEKTNDYQCSICNGDLTYFNEEEEIFPEINDHLNVEHDPEIVDNFDTMISTDNMINGQSDVEEIEHNEIKNDFKEAFIGNLDEDLNTEASINNDIENEILNPDLKETKNDKISWDNKISSVETKIFHINRRPYNKAIGLGVIIVLIGFIDIYTTIRSYGYYAIVLGTIIFIIGLILYKKWNIDELRNVNFKKNLSMLLESFNILQTLKLPDSDEIDHIIIGNSGIFPILTKNVNNFNKMNIDEKKIFKNENFTETEIVRNPQNTEGNVIYTISSSPLSYNKIKKVRNSDKVNIKFDFDENIKFSIHDRIKKNSIERSEKLINFLYKNNFNSVYAEPLVAFINKEIILINLPLTDEYLLLDDFLSKIINNKNKFDDEEVKDIVDFLSTYSRT
ncbi:MAG: NERD domain-containing protein [Methanobrevibacter sp.]|nr:NERD domain-containing protein [Candidatus Methanovirga australis]